MLWGLFKMTAYGGHDIMRAATRGSRRRSSTSRSRGTAAPATPLGPVGTTFVLTLVAGIVALIWWANLPSTKAASDKYYRNYDQCTEMLAEQSLHNSPGLGGVSTGIRSDGKDDAGRDTDEQHDWCRDHS